MRRIECTLGALVLWTEEQSILDSLNAFVRDVVFRCSRYIENDDVRIYLLFHHFSDGIIGILAFSSADNCAMYENEVLDQGAFANVAFVTPEPIYDSIIDCPLNDFDDRLLPIVQLFAGKRIDDFKADLEAFGPALPPWRFRPFFRAIVPTSVQISRWLPDAF